MTSCRPISPLNILLADDNEANCLIALTILKRAGHSVTTVRTGDQALRLTKIASYDLIILDALMPVMDGLQALQHIRQENSINQTALIFAFSTFCDAEDREKYSIAGFDATLSKPLRSGDLESALANLKLQSEALHSEPAEIYSIGHIPLLDNDIIHRLEKHETSDSLQQLQSRFWASIHRKCHIIETLLPAVLKSDDMGLTDFRRAVHSVKNLSDSIGLPRLAYISRYLRNSPPSEIPQLMDAFVTTLSESRPALKHALSGARQFDTSVQMRGEDQPETAHNGQNHCSTVGYQR